MLTTYGQMQRMSSQTVAASHRDWGFYQRLANRVVEVAAEDYQRALCGIATTRYRTPEDDIQELTNFFLGDWYKMLTDIDGKKLMERLEEECKIYGYDYAAIKRAHGPADEEELDDLD